MANLSCLVLNCTLQHFACGAFECVLHRIPCYCWRRRRTCLCFQGTSRVLHELDDIEGEFELHIEEMRSCSDYNYLRRRSEDLSRRNRDIRRCFAELFPSKSSNDQVKRRPLIVSEELKLERQKAVDKKDEILENCFKISIDCATAVLASYNGDHGTDYVLVYPLFAYPLFKYGGLWYHCNFTAIPKTQLASLFAPHWPQFFFAELLNGINAESVTSCVKLDGPHYRHGCKGCPCHVLHPLGQLEGWEKLIAEKDSG